MATLMAADGLRSMVVIRTDRLGETLLLLPAVAALKAAQPAARITVLVQETLVPLLQGAPGVDGVQAYRPDGSRWWWRRAAVLARQLRCGSYDAAVVVNPHRELHVAVWLAGIPRRIGYARKWGWCLTERRPDRKEIELRHEAEHDAALLAGLGVTALPAAWRLPVSDAERQAAAQRLTAAGAPPGRPLVAVHPWTSHPAKQWPAERFAAVMRRLTHEARVMPVLLGGPEERAAVAGVAAEDVPYIDLVGRTSLRELAAVLTQVGVLVSNDSGPVHVAAAVGTPTVVLFGTDAPSTGPARWRPWGLGHRVLCGTPLTAISVDAVVGAVRDLLGPRA